MTKSGRVKGDLIALIRARNTLLWIVTREEARAERVIFEAAATLPSPMDTRYWDCAAGLVNGDKTELTRAQDPQAALSWIQDNKARAVYVMRDLHKWLDPITLRMLRNAARNFQTLKADEAKVIVVLSPSSEIPPELSGHVTVIEFPLPDREEITAILDAQINGLPETMQAPTTAQRDAIIDATLGLSANEAEDCYARSLVTLKRIDPALVSAEKKRVIAREKVLTWYDPDPRGLDAVGGLNLLKDWLRARRAAFGPKARAFGLSAPKGIMLLGHPGGGKSLVAKSVAGTWGMPLLRLDLGALRSKYVGESEGNIRRALAVAEAVAPATLWVDEIEKALAGSTGAQGDGGVAADALGTLLSWMQERQGSVFVIATANDVRSLPPELLRKGRFDETFWVDLPTSSERESILMVTLKQHRDRWSRIDMPQIAEATKGFTGAEIAALVPEALFTAFNDNERDITTEDIMAAVAATVPQSKTAAERFEALRGWAKDRARPASAPETTVTSARRTLEV